ncbi:MAG: hypothetical protein LBP75_10150 [Planctomycetota bacterium]|jgi:hypothetical protein|nr:hypothetical protein [Planctomycetota bacterium]
MPTFDEAMFALAARDAPAPAPAVSVFKVIAAARAAQQERSWRQAAVASSLAAAAAVMLTLIMDFREPASDEFTEAWSVAYANELSWTDE